MERVNQCALRYAYKDKGITYDNLLDCIGLSTTLEGRRAQDMLITINNCIQDKAPRPPLYDSFIMGI